MHRDNDDELDEYDTLDEAIAAAMAELEPGGVLQVHSEDCQSEDGEEGCTCEPLSLTVGARA
jgi:hypothetical protein